MEEIAYPIGDSSFTTIRTKKQFYVDKTEYIFRMAFAGKYFFLSRPRRFGKSLLVSAMEAYFKGQRGLFEGLKIYALETEWKKHEVLRFDLSAGDMTDAAGLDSYLHATLSKWEKIYGRDEEETSLGSRFAGIIDRAHAISGNGVVVLIDEYDNPLFSTIDNPESHEKMRTTLKGLYSVLKSKADEIRFCFLTGITRFSKMSVFSGLNNLRDITLNPLYSGICGITQKELEENCKSGIETVAEAKGVGFSEALRLLKERYDGYHFGDLHLDVFNPYSLIQTFPEGIMDSYWFASGTSEFLWKQISRLTDIHSLIDILNPIVERSQLGVTEDDGLKLEALLFQTGYLTLKESFEDGWAYRLGVPNKEVREGIFGGLLPLISGKRREDTTADILALRRYAREIDVDGMMIHIRSFLAGISNRISRKMPEIYYENNLFILFSLIGIKTTEEKDTADGRMDLVLELADIIYIIELKLDRPAKEAMQQIIDKRYWLPYQRSGKKIILLGISFSSKIRNIESWEWQRISDNDLV